MCSIWSGGCCYTLAHGHTGCVCTPTMAAAAAEEVGDNFEVCVVVVEEPVGWVISNSWLRNSSQFRLRIKSSLLTQQMIETILDLSLANRMFFKVS